MSTETIVVTRHGGLVEYLVEEGIIREDTPVIDHATPDTVRDKHIIGVLPLHLAVHARSVTEIPMDIPAELRGQELTAEQTRQFAGRPRTYEVQGYFDIAAAEADKANADYGWDRWWLHRQYGSPGSGYDRGVEGQEFHPTLAVALAWAKDLSLRPEGRDTVFAVAPSKGGDCHGLPVAGYRNGKLGTYGFVPSLVLSDDTIPEEVKS